MSKKTNIPSQDRRVLAWLSAVCLAAPLALASPSSASAQGGATVMATVRAVASPGGMPTIKRLRVQPDEFTAVDTLLEKRIGDALADRGIAVDPKAPMILYYDTEISGETVNPAPQVNNTAQSLFAPGELGRIYGQLPPSVSPFLPMPQNGGSDIAGQPVQGSGQPYGLSFVIGKPDADPVWSGAIRTTMPAQDPEAVARVMVPPLVKAIGRSGRATILIPVPRVD